MPLLDALRQDRMPQFLAKLLLEAGFCTDAANLHLEYQVKPFKGRGKASHTDLMVIQPGQPGRSLAIEAKWTEPRYETVSKWLGGGLSPENRKAVLGGWLEKITERNGQAIDPDICGDLVYQMVHRAASAVKASGTDGAAAMAYLIFQSTEDRNGDGAARLEKYREDLKRFRTIIGSPQTFPFFLVSVTIRPTKAFDSLSGLRKGSAATSEAVGNALRGGASPLFDFGEGFVERF